MAWSGVTKYLRTVCQVKQRPVELPGLGIFMPVNCAKSNEAEGATRLTSSALGQFKDADYDVKLFLSQQFLNKCSSAVSVAEDGMISSYDPSLGEHQYIKGLQHLNFGSVSRVCDTDLLSVEMIVKEIVAQLRY